MVGLIIGILLIVCIVILTRYAISNYPPQSKLTVFGITLLGLILAVAVSANIGR